MKAPNSLPNPFLYRQSIVYVCKEYDVCNTKRRIVRKNRDRAMGKLKMTVLSVLALSSADIGNTRLIILMLLIVAVVLILIGCLIALMTLRKRLKSQNVENERP